MSQQSAVILVCMAIDRYLYLLHPDTYHKHSSKKVSTFVVKRYILALFYLFIKSVCQLLCFIKSCFKGQGCVVQRRRLYLTPFFKPPRNFWKWNVKQSLIQKWNCIIVGKLLYYTISLFPFCLSSSLLLYCREHPFIFLFLKEFQPLFTTYLL